MTKAEILIEVLSEVAGKPESFVRDLLADICAANPKIAKGFAVEVPDNEAQQQIEAMRAEGPGILLRLMRGAQDVAAHDSGTVH